METPFVVPTLLYGGAETWALTADQFRPLASFYNSCLRSITNQRRGPNGISNQELYDLANARPLSDILADHKMRYVGHVVRRPPHALVHQMLGATGIPGHTRPRGAPKLQYFRSVESSLQQMGVLGNWAALAQDRQGWSKLCAAAH